MVAVYVLHAARKALDNLILAGARSLQSGRACRQLAALVKDGRQITADARGRRSPTSRVGVRLQDNPFMKADHLLSVDAAAANAAVKRLHQS